MFAVDRDLIKKYDTPGPRYTSYPTAPQMTESFTHGDYAAEIARTNAADTPEADLAPLSLYYHIPFCDTLCYFCGCNMMITQNPERVTRYVAYLKKEIELLRAAIHPKRRVTQLHWGGGTPTHLNPGEIEDLKSAINNAFTFDEDAEQSCEIDPRGLTRAHLEALRASGFNRISMGVQDFEPKVQQAVNRIQPEDITRQTVQWTRELEFHSINLDLMYGLPHQTVKSFSDTLDKVIDISPDRLAIFNYAHVPWLKKHMRLIKEEDLPSPDVKLQLLFMTIEKLTDAGYVYIGMDHFAKPDDELSIALRNKELYRNFQGYSTRAGADLYGMGMTGISQLFRVYTQNHKTEKPYFDALDEGILPTARGYLLDDDDILRRSVIMELMCNFDLDIARVERRFNIAFADYFAQSLRRLDEMARDGLVIMNDAKIEVTGMGRLLIRNIAMNFDKYILLKEDKTKYSRTV